MMQALVVAVHKLMNGSLHAQYWGAYHMGLLKGVERQECQFGWHTLRIDSGSFEGFLYL